MDSRVFVENTIGGKVVTRIDIATRVVQRPIPIAGLVRYRQRRAGRERERQLHDCELLHPTTSSLGAACRRRLTPEGSAGSTTTNVVPFATSLSTVIRPPWASTISFAIARPNPV